jgi:putative holliday junction resolvase
MLKTRTNIIALDMGERRIGVARANLIARLPEPLSVLNNSESVLSDIRALVDTEDAAAVVVGLPRGMNGQYTAQTVEVEEFIDKLKNQLDIPVYAQDETLTSVKAEKELNAKGRKFEKGMIDALSASYILDDFLHEHMELPR